MLNLAEEYEQTITQNDLVTDETGVYAVISHGLGKLSPVVAVYEIAAEQHSHMLHGVYAVDTYDVNSLRIYPKNGVIDNVWLVKVVG